MTQPSDINELSQRDKEMDDLLITLICSLYLNLSRNPENIQELVSLKLFEKLSGDITEIFNESCFLYTTSIFSNLLELELTHKAFMEEKGYEFFFKILSNKEKHQHLFMETLDSIKLLLTKREYLHYFKKIIYLDQDQNNFQVLAILSFDLREDILSQGIIIENIEYKLKTMARNGWFDIEEFTDIKNRGRPKRRARHLADKDWVDKRRNMIPDWNTQEFRKEKKDFILALSIILSNL